MPFYLASNLTGTNDHVSLTSNVQIALNEYVEIDVFYQDNGETFQMLVDFLSNGGDYLTFASDQIALRVDGTVTNSSTTFVSGRRYVVRLERINDGVQKYNVYVDGNLEISHANTATIDEFSGLIGTGSGSFHFTGRLFDAEYGVISGSVTAKWEPTASLGTGSTLPDTVGSNDGTLVNYPGDDSEWVEYNDPPTTEVGVERSTVFTNTDAGFSTTSFESSGSDRALYAFAAFDSPNAVTFTEFSYNSVALTQVAETTTATGRKVFAYRLLNPPVGTFDLSIDWDHTDGVGDVRLGAILLTNVNQTTPESGTGSTEANSGSTISIPTITSNETDLLLGFTFLNNSSIDDMFDGANQALESFFGSNDYSSLSSKDGATTSQSLEWIIGSQSYGAVGVSVKAEPSGPGVTVTQADTTPEDGVQQSVTSTGLTVAYTASTLAGKAITFSNSDPTTASTYTLDVSAVEASEGMPRIGETSTLSVTATGGTATTDVVIQPKTGWTAVTLAGTLDKAANGFLATLDSDLGVTSAVGDIIYYSNARGEVITATGVYTGGTTVAFQSTEFVIQQGGSATTTATSEGGAFFPFGEGDTPDQFTFTDQTGLELSALTESNTITVLGVTPATDFLASITGGEYAVDSGSGFGAFTSSNTNVQLNYDVKVRNTTSGSYSTAVNTALTIASTSDTFTTTTRAQLAPVLAATKSFSRRINQASTGVIVPTGGDTPTSYSNPAGADGAQYTINSSGVWERTVNNPTVESEVFTTTATNAAGTSDAITVTVNYTSSGIPATKFRRFPWQGYNPL